MVFVKAFDSFLDKLLNSFSKRDNKFRTRIVVNSKEIHLGLFETAFEAARVYDSYVIDNNLEHTRNFN